jgi:hypothetical protein
MSKQMFLLLLAMGCGGHQPAQAEHNINPVEETVDRHLDILTEMAANGELAELLEYNPIPDGEIVCLDKECKMVVDDFYSVAWACFGGAGIGTKIANYDYTKHLNGEVVKAFTGSDEFKKIGTYLATQARRGKFLRLTSYLSAMGLAPLGIKQVVMIFAAGGCAVGVGQTLYLLNEKQNECRKDLEAAKAQLAKEQELFAQNLRLSENLNQCQNNLNQSQDNLNQCQENVRKQEKKLDYLIRMTEALSTLK